MILEMERDVDVILNTRLMTYDIKVSKSTGARVRGYGYDDNTTLAVVVTNLLACIRKNSLLVYSRKTSGRSNSKKGVTARKVIKCVDFLCSIGYVTNHIGKSHADREKRQISYICPTEKFIEDWNMKDLVDEAMESYNNCLQVIELRDEDRKNVPYRNTQDTKKMEEVVRNLNRLNESVQIRDGNGDILTNFYCRIFNESFDYGGRFYKADILAIKNKVTSARLDITIDGQSVVEIDFSNLHFRIAAALESIDYQEIPTDVYSGILEDESNYVDRRIVKLAVNIMFNCYNEDSAERAINLEINKLTKEEKSIYTLGRAKSVMLLVFDAYPDFIELFCNKSSYGRILQNADSHLANDILEKMIEKGIPCLPVHDSFIVQAKHLDILCSAMGDCFRKRFGVDWLVPVGISWKENGVKIEEKICV